MSWSISASGTKQSVVDAVTAQQRNPEIYDTPHWQSAKDHILAAVGRAPDGCAVDVAAMGHADEGHSYESISVKCSPS